jgi:hypothetical protein
VNGRPRPVFTALTRNSAHRSKRVGEEFRAAEIAGLQRQKHFAMFHADGTHHGDAGGDFSTPQKAGNPKATHPRAGGLAAGGPNVW